MVEAPRPRVQDGFHLCFTISTLLSCKFNIKNYLAHWIQLPILKSEFSEFFDQMFVYLLFNLFVTSNNETTNSRKCCIKAREPLFLIHYFKKTF